MSNTLPILPLKDTVVFPDIVVPLRVGRSKSMAAVNSAVENGRELICVGQRDAEIEEPSFDDLYRVGTIVRISRIERRDDGAQVIVQGGRRVRLLASEANEANLRASYELLPELSIDAQPEPERSQLDAYIRENLATSQRIALLYDSNNGEQIYQQLIGSISNPVTQLYRIASLANLSLADEQAVLENNTTLALAKHVHELLQHEQKVIELRRQIAEDAHEEVEQQQREHMLRQQKRAIEQALGEPEEDDDVRELRADIDKADLPDEVRQEVDRELKRLARMSSGAADYQVARSYLELVAELPWQHFTTDKLDLKNAREVLDADHFGLDDIKQRIIESLAVLKLNAESKAPILCLVGPPGVGKTSLGQSIARAMGRQFDRISLGGLHDEAELRGHRRTYVGAMPGRIIQGIRRAGAANPVLMLDEIDKLGQDFRGDPSAALMEILDPAQNREFRDNYLNLPFDLSKVFFITTANTLQGIPRPLLDRMEILELSGYSDLEKSAIAQRYLLPRQRTEAGLTDKQLTVADDAMGHIIHRYTREAGVRELERVLGQLARKRALEVVQKKRSRGAVGIRRLRELLGPPKFQGDPARRNLPAGVAAGLAYTESGGDVLYVEAVIAGSDDKLTLTGHLGQVMQESVSTARGVIRSQAEALGISADSINGKGIHVHVPAGAIPKDGPSAGVTMATALASAYSGVPVRDDLAMTGELTLTGLVLAVGGVKEKLLAAHRSGLRNIVLPKDNESDLEQLPESVREDLTITLASRLEDVLAVALPDLKPTKGSTKPAGTPAKPRRKARKTAAKAQSSADRSTGKNQPSGQPTAKQPGTKSKRPGPAKSRRESTPPAG
ncbi:MAG: endopeptidase La [Pseudomonadaceae bacterium]|nr:endopeptidase La [Pseudomonadaceae bacterium]